MSESLPSLMPRLEPKARTSRLDRLAWRAGACVEAHGVRLGLRTNAPSVLDELRRYLPPGWRSRRSAVVDELFSIWVDPDPGRARPSRVYVGGRRRVRTRDLGHALAVLEALIGQLYLVTVVAVIVTRLGRPVQRLGKLGKELENDGPNT